MKIVLINPPDEYLENAGDRPPLGLAYLATYAREHGFKNIKIVDMNHDKKIPKADIYGMTAVTPSYTTALRIARELKAKYHVPVILGGPHASAVPKMIATFDQIIVGEGEEAFVRILKGEAKERIVYGKPVEKLDDLPMPAWDLLPMEKYTLKLNGERAMSLMTSRGCPFQCVFCGKQVYGRTWRAHSAERVLDEMTALIVWYGIDHFIIYDDMFTLDKSRIYKLAKLLKDGKVGVKFRCTTRADNVDSELLKTLKFMGCLEICYGVESGNDQILKGIKKGMTTQQNLEAIRETKRLGMKTKAYFIIGLPFETRATVMQTLAFAKKANPDFADFYILTPYPGSELWDDPTVFGMTIDRDCYWDYVQAGKTEQVPRIYDRSLGKFERLELHKEVVEEWKKFKGKMK